MTNLNKNKIYVNFKQTQINSTLCRDQSFSTTAPSVNLYAQYKRSATYALKATARDKQFNFISEVIDVGVLQQMALSGKS